jgi:endonuclease/exonuclease/phosphatase family metal-dependent hydrolase
MLAIWSSERSRSIQPFGRVSGTFGKTAIDRFVFCIFLAIENLMKVTALLLIGVIVVAARPTHAAAPMEVPMKVMTFNIRYDGGATGGEETPWKADVGTPRRDMVLQVIAEEDPDLLALQEALPHQVDDVHGRFEQYDLYSIGRDDGARAGEHCAILYRSSRFEKVDAGTFWLCESPSEPGSKFPGAACPRIASWVHLRDRKAGGGELMFVNTHWDHVSQPARQYAAGAIMTRLANQSPDGRAVLVGDLNARPNSEEVGRLLSDEDLPLVDAYRQVHSEERPDEATFNGFKNRTRGERIDYVFHSEHFSPISARIVRTTVDGANASDHFPVVVEVE